MEHKLKQRLIGIVVLLAFIAILLPFLFSGSHKAEKPAAMVAVDIPAATVTTPEETTPVVVPETAPLPVVTQPEVPVVTQPEVPPEPAVTQPEPVAVPEPVVVPKVIKKPVAKKPTRWTVQLNCFANNQGAQSFANNLRTKGFTPYIKKQCVFVGNEADAAKAGKIADTLQQLFGYKTKVIKTE